MQMYMQPLRYTAGGSETSREGLLRRYVGQITQEWGLDILPTSVLLATNTSLQLPRSNRRTEDDKPQGGAILCEHISKTHAAGSSNLCHNCGHDQE